MNLLELKKLLKPLIRDIVKEVILEEQGIISHVIKESMTAIAGNKASLPVQQLQEEVKSFQPRKLPSDVKDQLAGTRKKLLEAIGKDAYNGVDLFAGTEPLRENAPTVTPMGSVPSPLANMDPSDPGVPIDKFFDTQNWAKLAAGKKKK
jgi:hypothetical protein